jgi:hypothetical protein
MNKTSVKIKNCYGIRSFEAIFNFSKKKANIFYAPNGMMKTSFARTFKDYSNNIESKDRIYQDREPTREITDENGNPVPVSEIFVIEPYVSDYESSRISTLLVNKELKKEYDQILKGIDAKQKDLVTLLKNSSGLQSGLEDIFSVVISKEPKNFLRALERVRTEVNEETKNPLAQYQYISIFNDKVEKFLLTKDFIEKLEDYTKNYDTLLSSSSFFRKGVFNHYQAGEISKQLKTHGFFKADHTVFLNKDGEKVEVTSEDQLEEFIAEEMKTILSDDKLKKSFNEIDTKLKANADLRNFREFLLSNMNIIPELTNLELFKEKLWKAYLIAHKDSFQVLMAEYDVGKKRIQEITEAATEQATKWQEVINIFNRRFSVPFKVTIANKQDVILKQDTPNIEFQFSDGGGAPIPVERSQLIDVLSNGEKRALYILNIIFEVEARKQAGIPTLFIVDDIADSFDYKNKYAIVEYLQWILTEGDFKQIILTHNYDFYRTIWKRLELGGANYHVTKNAGEVKLVEETMYRDPFQKWKANAEQPDKTDMLIAMIPFVRNLAEYCGFGDEETKLTSLLHIKADTNDITVKDLTEVFKKVLNEQEFGELEGNEEPVKAMIFAEATRIAALQDIGADLEKKVVLSIAIRLAAEEFAITKIDEDEWVTGLSSNQTAKLINRYKEKFSAIEGERSNIRILEQVNLMTPENIHLNSFMFEPILDMSAEHLAQLHTEIMQL